MLTITPTSLDDLKPNPRNPKRHAIDAVRASIRAYGMRQPILADERTGLVLGGHGRIEALRAMREAGETAPPGCTLELADAGAVLRWMVPVVWMRTESDEAATALLLALNRTEELGGWDPIALQKMLDPLALDLRGLAGYDPKAIKQLGRVCYGLDLDPAYVDVAVARWESLTGRKAELERPA